MKANFKPFGMALVAVAWLLCGYAHASPPPAGVPVYMELSNGVTIYFPDGAKSCTYDAEYCARGWAADGSFPGMQLHDAIKAAIEGAIDMCDDEPAGGLTLGGAGPADSGCWRWVPK